MVITNNKWNHACVLPNRCPIAIIFFIAHIPVQFSPGLQCSSHYTELELLPIPTVPEGRNHAIVYLWIPKKSLEHYLTRNRCSVNVIWVECNDCNILKLIIVSSSGRKNIPTIGYRWPDDPGKVSSLVWYEWGSLGTHFMVGRGPFCTNNNENK